MTREIFKRKRTIFSIAAVLCIAAIGTGIFTFYSRTDLAINNIEVFYFWIDYFHVYGLITVPSFEHSKINYSDSLYAEFSAKNALQFVNAYIEKPSLEKSGTYYLRCVYMGTNSSEDSCYIYFKFTPALWEIDKLRLKKNRTVYIDSYFRGDSNGMLHYLRSKSVQALDKSARIIK
jgi:hypothetical protein